MDELIQSILDRLAKIEEEFSYMLDNYEGCDWCCGGGDQWWEDNIAERERLEQRLGELTLGFCI